MSPVLPSFCQFDDDSAISGQGVLALVVYLADDMNLVVLKGGWHVHFNCRRGGIADSCLCLTDAIIRDVAASLKQFRAITTKYGVSDEWTGRVETTIIGHLKAWG